MTLRRLSLFFCAAALLPLSLHAQQTGTFDLLAGKKVVGKDTYTLKKDKAGFRLSSRMGTKSAAGDSDIADDFKYNESYLYLDGGASSLTAQSHSNYTPNKTRTGMTIGTTRAGVQDSSNLVIKPDFSVLPHNDAGAAQAFLLLAVLHPTADNLYNILVPAGAAAAPAEGDAPDAGKNRAPSGNNAFDARFGKQAEAAGTLDGKPVALHTYVLAAGNFTWTFYADDTNTLMQVDNTMARSSYVRQKFILNAVSGN